MAAVAVTKNSMMSKTELIIWLKELAEELGQLGFADEADRAREIAKEVNVLRR